MAAHAPSKIVDAAGTLTEAARQAIQSGSIAVFNTKSVTRRRPCSRCVLRAEHQGIVRSTCPVVSSRRSAERSLQARREPFARRQASSRMCATELCLESIDSICQILDPAIGVNIEAVEDLHGVVVGAL